MSGRARAATDASGPLRGSTRASRGVTTARTPERWRLASQAVGGYTAYGRGGYGDAFQHCSHISPPPPQPGRTLEPAPDVIQLAVRELTSPSGLEKLAGWLPISGLRTHLAHARCRHHWTPVRMKRVPSETLLPSKPPRRHPHRADSSGCPGASTDCFHAVYYISCGKGTAGRMRAYGDGPSTGSGSLRWNQSGAKSSLKEKKM